LDAKGQVRVEAISSRRNLLTDELVTTASGSNIDAKSTDAKTDAKTLAELSNLAGGLVCEKTGVVPINKEQLLAEAIRVLA
jgi:hypothetical protein